MVTPLEQRTIDVLEPDNGMNAIVDTLTRVDDADTVCVTGHRPDKLGGYDRDSKLNKRIINTLDYAVEDLVICGIDTFITGMALGVDQWFAEAVNAMREGLAMNGSHAKNVRLVAAVPFEGQASKWPSPSRKRWRRIIERCNEVEQVCDGGYSPSKYQRRNEWMVDRSDVVLAVWNGGRGGTFNCVEYAIGEDVPVLRIDPRRLE